jgi:hypothetical protein
MHDILLAKPPNSNAAKMFHEKDMKSALAEMNSVLIPNTSEIAKKMESRPYYPYKAVLGPNNL